MKSLSTATFEVQQPASSQRGEGGGGGGGGGGGDFTAGLYEGLTGTEGVLAVELLRTPPFSSSFSSQPPQRREGGLVRVVVTYESELVGLRDLIKAMRAQGYPARYLPASSSSSSSSFSSSSPQEEHLKAARHRLLFALLLSLPVTLLSMLPPSTPLLDLPPLSPGLRLRDVLLLLLSTPVQFGPGWVFYREAYKGKERVGGWVGGVGCLPSFLLCRWVIDSFLLFLSPIHPPTFFRPTRGFVWHGSAGGHGHHHRLVVCSLQVTSLPTHPPTFLCPL